MKYKDAQRNTKKMRVGWGGGPPCVQCISLYFIAVLLISEKIHLNQSLILFILLRKYDGIPIEKNALMHMYINELSST